MTSSMIAIQDEYAKLVELGRETIWDWVFYPKFGFFNQHGLYMDKLNLYNYLKIFSGSGYCKINYINIYLFYDIVIRLPSIALLSIIGIIIGFYGFIKFSKHSSKLSFSFIFFMFMNMSGLLFHSLLPLSTKNRIIFRVIDHAATGTSGIFLSLELLSMLNSNNNNNNNKEISFSSSQIAKYIGIVFILFLLSNVGILGELIYITGCASVFVSCCYIQLKSIKNKINSDLRSISIYCMLLFIGLAISTPFNKILCQATYSFINLISILFFISDIGFAIVLYFGIKRFGNGNVNDSDSNKNKKTQ